MQTKIRCIIYGVRYYDKHEETESNTNTAFKLSIFCQAHLLSSGFNHITTFCVVFILGIT